MKLTSELKSRNFNPISSPDLWIIFIKTAGFKECSFELQGGVISHKFVDFFYFKAVSQTSFSTLVPLKPGAALW